MSIFKAMHSCYGIDSCNAVGFQDSARDITQHKVAGEALIESERSKSLLLSNLPGMAYRKVIAKAFHFLNRLKSIGYSEISVSINVSAIQLLKPDFASRLFEIISGMQVNPKNIGIEITESVFASDYENIHNIIEKLRDAGLHIAIDDFGTGYSSLARERELKVDCLKIDKYFIDKLVDADLNKAITSDIISMSYKLGHCKNI